MKKGKSLGLFVLLLLFFLIFIFLFVGSIFVCINNFVEIPNEVLLWCGVGIALVSVILSVLTVRNTKRIGETRFSFWIGKSFPKLLIGYFLLLFAFASIKSQPTWTVEMVYDILSLQWTIFGLSLTIFLVWNVIIVEFLKKRQPQENKSSDLLQKYKLILDKNSFYKEIETTFLTMILLTVNLFLLLISTSLIYISVKPETIFTQNILRFSFFFTTNSIVSLFLDILRPLKKEKEEMLDNNKVTVEEVNDAYGICVSQAIIDGIKKAVMELDPEKYTEEEKIKLIIGYLETFKEGFKKMEKDDSGKKGKHTH